MGYYVSVLIVDYPNSVLHDEMIVFVVMMVVAEVVVVVVHRESTMEMMTLVEQTFVVVPMVSVDHG
ncbi:MAG: hypothetical protein QRY16_22005 [Enterobacterales bacterium endosymbiont of Blomia tropicalis]|uniref:hypothetical protein n=1 Tax=Mixta mediterraneensis TaxID=2758443 RepID=UPI0025A82F80|nr:hypothetical protein [Mixta mediterraneensis]MDL4916330.1 hypothetical protein [Mixta mediterraneensis]